jgi:hypothetical protein
MEAIPIMSKAREELAEAVSSGPISPPSPIACSPWIAMSLMQKAIRRGREDLALRAAATLLRDSPERLWRRSGIIAFEDIGVADLATVGKVVAALGGKTFRARLGGEWPVASTIVSAMARAPKCRAADDLLMIVQRHPALEEARRTYASLPSRDLLGIATGSSPLPKRALALCYAVGTNRGPPDYLRPRAGEPEATFDYLFEAGFPASAVEIAREGHFKVGDPLCNFLPLLGSLLPTPPHEFTDDLLPPERMIGDAPSWAVDVFTREGRRAIQSFLARNSAMSRWTKKHVPGDKRVEFLGNLIFAVEGGLLRSRLVWSMGELLRQCAEFECQGSWCPDAREITALMRADLPLLNEVRAEVMGNAHHAR